VYVQVVNQRSPPIAAGIRLFTLWPPSRARRAAQIPQCPPQSELIRCGGLGIVRIALATVIEDS
jgi:hypothetical protein